LRLWWAIVGKKRLYNNTETQRKDTTINNK
jgi:hypothetical protein